MNYETQGLKRIPWQLHKMDLHTGVWNSELRATFAYGRGCVCKLSALGRGAAGHFRAQAWYKTHIPFSWVGGAARPPHTGKREMPACPAHPVHPVIPAKGVRRRPLGAWKHAPEQG